MDDDFALLPAPLNVRKEVAQSPQIELTEAIAVLTSPRLRDGCGFSSGTMYESPVVPPPSTPITQHRSEVDLSGNMKLAPAGKGLTYLSDITRVAEQTIEQIIHYKDASPFVHFVKIALPISAKAPFSVPLDDLANQVKTFAVLVGKGDNESRALFRGIVKNRIDITYEKLMRVLMDLALRLSALATDHRDSDRIRSLRKHMVETLWYLGRFTETLIRHMEHYVGVKVLRVQLVESRYGKPEHLITQLDRAHGNWVMVEPTSKEKLNYKLFEKGRPQKGTDFEKSPIQGEGFERSPW